MLTIVFLETMHKVLSLYNEGQHECEITDAFVDYGVCYIYMGIVFDGQSLWQDRLRWRKALSTWPEFSGDYSHPIKFSDGPKWMGEEGKQRLRLFRHLIDNLGIDKFKEVQGIHLPHSRYMEIAPRIFEEFNLEPF